MVPEVNIPEKELIAIALYNQKKINEVKKKRKSNDIEEDKYNEYPKYIDPVALPESTSCNNKQEEFNFIRTKNALLAKSDPVECETPLERQVYYYYEKPQKRHHSLIPELLLKTELVKDPKRSTSCIFDYILPCDKSPPRELPHTRSMSDNTIDSSSCCEIAKNYRYC